MSKSETRTKPRRMSNLYIIPEDGEPFTRSTCRCNQCIAMHASVTEWDTFAPETNLQKRMKEVVEKLDQKYGQRPNAE